jgi:NAD(P)-dependent dehydrogenase (short-subunit alcohol dehydrogenase family)
MAYDPTAKVPSFSVAGYHVLISGGTGGIGSAFARAFLGHGARVTVTDMKPPPADLAGKVTFETLDVRDSAAVNALAARIDTLNVLIHCAGRLVRMQEFEVDTFADIVNIHLTGAMRLATAFRPHLARSKGAIINIGSMYSYFGSPKIPGYTAAKTGIVGLTRSLAVSFAGDGIRVNCIAPGWINTEISRGARDDPQMSRAVLERLPIGRWAEPEELAGTAVFLASPAAHYITGATINVDGGYVAT